MTIDRGALHYVGSPAAARVSPVSVLLSWRVLTATLVACDAAAVGIAFAIAYLVRFRAGLPLLETPPYTLAFYSSIAFWAVPVWLALFVLYGLYDRQHLFTGFAEYARVVNACTVGLLVVVCMSFFDVTLLISRAWLLLTWVLSFLLVCSVRFASRRVVRRLREHGLFVTSAVIVGTNEEARALADQLGTDPGSGARVIGLIGTSGQPTDQAEGGLPILGGLGDLRAIVDAGQVGEIIVAPTALSRNELLELYRLFGHDGAVELRFSSGLFEILTTGIRVKETSCIPLVTPQRVRITGIDATLKATLDYAVALTALTALSGLMAVISLLVRLDSPGPILHRRRVLGRSGQAFDAFKFRTMVVDADRVLDANPELKAAFDRGYKLKRDPRVTRVGAFLRRTSLDELPQLLNVLRGEMSLVGPRMISPDEAARYGKWQLNLLTVKPGITGPWQVRGRGDIPYDERIRLSMHYIRNYSIWLDLEILLRTVPAVVHGTGAY
jgi:exopolysaccharide biosynthesis polyprenyl glycosylphosphotransferase